MFLAMLLTAPACGGDDGSGPPAEDLQDLWAATKAEFVSVANPSTKADLIALGGEFTVDLKSGGLYEVFESNPDQGWEYTFTGTWESSSDVLTLNLIDGEIQFDMSLSGNTLTLSGGHVDFDFDGDGTFEEAILNAVLARQ
jgi:hypothetical protein